MDGFLLFISGITFSVGIISLFFAWRGDKRYKDTLFGFLAISSALYYLIQSGETQSSTAPILGLFSATVFFSLFPWYIAYYAHYVKKTYLWSITIMAIGFFSLFLLELFTGITDVKMVFSHLFYISASVYCLIASFHWLKNKVNFSSIFHAIGVLYFAVFSIEEILVDRFDFKFLWRTNFDYNLLDFFPMIFVFLKIVTVVNDLILKSKFEKSNVTFRRNWQNYLNNSNLLIVDLDEKGHIQYINPYFLGYLNNSTPEKHAPFHLQFISEKEQPLFTEIYNSSEIRGELQSNLILPEGQKSIYWSFLKFTDAESEREDILLTGIDITSEKMAEKKIKEVNEELEILNQKLESENFQLHQSLSGEDFANEKLIGESEELRYVLSKVEDIAKSNVTVLLEGETGVGKEVFATEIYQNSERRFNPFIKVNCAALPTPLLESELFGYEKGAFTGADKNKKGRFLLADKGTLFLDEIGEFPMEIQPKLLRVLQEGEFEPLGSERTYKVDVRVILATNKDLAYEVEKGTFRSDLYYRVNVFPITIPPLRKRKGDIRLLVRSFVNELNNKYKKDIQEIPGSLMEELENYPWPGNVRELKNVLERSVITSNESTLKLTDHLPDLLNSNGKNHHKNFGNEQSLVEVERSHIYGVLQDCDWKISGENGAAQILGMPASTLRSKMKKLDIKRT